jgi:CheY-like chemotaxis protein
LFFPSKKHRVTFDQAPIRVLVVDDDRLVADSLALIVRGRGFESRAVYSGEEAVDIALTWKPDAVIADVIMGKLDGVALATYLAQVLPACRVLLISGNLDAAEMMNDSNQPGRVFPLLAKPVHPDHIFEFLGSSSRETSA